MHSHISNQNLQRGMDQNYAMRLAGKLNWVKRSLMGFKAQLHGSIFFEAVRHPEYQNMSDERKEQLEQLRQRFGTLRSMLETTCRMMDDFHREPKYTPEHTEKLKEAAKTRKGSSKSVIDSIPW